MNHEAKARRNARSAPRAGHGPTISWNQATLRGLSPIAAIVIGSAIAFCRRMESQNHVQSLRSRSAVMVQRWAVRVRAIVRTRREFSKCTAGASHAPNGLEIRMPPPPIN
jgi:hypothetical protein